MKIDRLALRQAVTDAVAAHRARHDARHAEWAELVAAERQRWVDEHLPRWGEAAKVIARKVRKGEPITGEELPKPSRYSGIETFDANLYSLRRPDGEIVRRPSEPYQPPHELISLGKALDVVTDEYVTHTGLRSLGITAATLRQALNALGATA